MPPATTPAFQNWLKSNPNIKLSSDAAVRRVLYEGITSFANLLDFDHKAIQGLPAICKEEIPAIAEDVANDIAAEPLVNGANVSTISVRRLCVAVDAAKYYSSIGRTLTVQKMHYTNVLSNFKVEYDAYLELKEEDEPKVPKINDRESEKKIIRWAPIFEDHLSRCFGAKGPLKYVVRDISEVPAEADDPLEANSYYGSSGSLLNELVARLPHTGPIYRNDNATVYMKIEEAVRGTSIESTIKASARAKDGRGAFMALIANHAGDTKYRAINKKRQNYLQNVKWNGRSYPLESHVSNHRVAFDDLRDCSNHITVTVPNGSQRVEYLIDSITCSDHTLQAAIGLVRANTNNMRNDFELAAASLIEVDPYRRSSRGNQNPGGRQANISAIDFHGGRGETGVDLRWHHPKEFAKLPSEQKDELQTWLRTSEGKKHKAESKKAAAAKRKAENQGDKERTNNNNGSWKKKLKNKMKTTKGLASVMSLLKEQEQSNQAFVSALQASASNPPAASDSSSSTPTTTTGTASALSAAMPATSIKLASILKNSNKK